MQEVSRLVQSCIEADRGHSNHLLKSIFTFIILFHFQYKFRCIKILFSKLTMITNKTILLNL